MQSNVCIGPEKCVQVRNKKLLGRLDLEAGIMIRMHLTILLQLFCEFMLNAKVTFKNDIDPDDVYSREEIYQQDIVKTWNVVCRNANISNICLKYQERSKN